MRVPRLPVFVAMALVLAGCAGADQPGGATTGAGGGEPAAQTPTAAPPAERGVPGLTVVESEGSVEQTTRRLKAALGQEGLTVAATVNHAAGAQRAGLTLPPTKLVIFGNPKLGTPLMQAGRTAAIDLPQKMLVWKGGDGQVRLGYNDPRYLADRHEIAGRDQVIQKMSKALRSLARSAATSS